MKRLSLAVVAALALAATAAAGSRPFPDVIPLPNGFQPEGISIGKGTTFYVGSIPTGAIYRGNLRTGAGSVLVPGRSGRAAIGVDYDRGRLFVAGGPTGRAFVYDAKSGRDVANLQLTTATTFVNDVVVTRSAAWFTDSINPVLYRVDLGKRGRIGPVTTVPLTGDISYQAGFNVNGIDATPNGKRLVVVQSNTGEVFTVNLRGVTREIDLGGATLTNGDGILLDGRRLYVVRNRDNEIVEIRLDRRLRAGRVVDRITDPDFAVPTTIDEFGPWLYAVNARFGTPPTPSTQYSLARVRK